MGQVRPIDASSYVGRATIERQTIRVVDAAATPSGHPQATLAQQRFGYRSFTATPLLREGQVIGVLAVSRQEVQPFTDAHVGLLEAFADQAVIAIENARLFQELQDSNRQVTEALEQQTALGDVLRVIASSPTDLDAVLHTIAATAGRLCNAGGGTITQVDGDVIRTIAAAGQGTVVPIGKTQPLVPNRPAGRAILDRVLVHIPDIDDEAIRAEFPDIQTYTARVLLHAPLLRDGAAIGTISLGRNDPRPFDPREIALLKTFADQAVVAIENARLFRELEQRTTDLTQALEQQTATPDPPRDRVHADRCRSGTPGHHRNGCAAV